jgi:hypothetical protein
VREAAAGVRAAATAARVGVLRALGREVAPPLPDAPPPDVDTATLAAAAVTPDRLARVMPPSEEPSVDMLRDVSRDVAAATPPRRPVRTPTGRRTRRRRDVAAGPALDESTGGVVTAVRPDEPAGERCPHCGQPIAPGWTFVCDKCRMPIA